MLTFSNKLFFLSLLIGCIFGKFGDELNLGFGDREVNLQIKVC